MYMHMYTCIISSCRCFGESLSTLNFARRAKMIKNKAVVNEDTSGSVPQLQAELRRLKELLERYKCEPTTTAAATSVSTKLFPLLPRSENIKGPYIHVHCT